MKKIIEYTIFYSTKGGGLIKLQVEGGEKIETPPLSSIELTAISLILMKGNAYYNSKKARFAVRYKPSDSSENPLNA